MTHQKKERVAKYPAIAEEKPAYGFINYVGKKRAYKQESQVYSG